MQFYKKPTKDIISQVKKNDKSRLRFEVKKLSLDIKKLYQSIQNQIIFQKDIDKVLLKTKR